MKQTIVLHNAQQASVALEALGKNIRAYVMAGHRLVVSVKPETRSDAQNRRMWAMLADVASQVDWHGQRLTSEEWKDVFTASLKRQKAVPGIEGGFVVLGARTSKMTIAEMGELMELMEAFGAEHGVRFTAPEYAEA